MPSRSCTDSEENSTRTLGMYNTPDIICIHSEPMAILAHESCIHVAVRVLHSSAFIVFFWCHHSIWGAIPSRFERNKGVLYIIIFSLYELCGWVFSKVRWSRRNNIAGMQHTCCTCMCREKRYEETCVCGTVDISFERNKGVLSSPSMNYADEYSAR